MGISYSKSVLTVGSKKYGAVSPGERFPFAPIIRIADWHPFDVQDLLPSDGRFKLIILPGSLIHPSSREQLSKFATSIRHCIKLQSSALAESHGGVISSRLAMYTVACDAKEDITWRQVPSDIAESWRWSVLLLVTSHDLKFEILNVSLNSCYTARDSVFEEMGENIYKQFGLAFSTQSLATSSATAAVLIRPDGYISMITGLEPADAERIILFMYNL